MTNAKRRLQDREEGRDVRPDETGKPAQDMVSDVQTPESQTEPTAADQGASGDTWADAAGDGADTPGEDGGIDPEDDSGLDLESAAAADPRSKGELLGELITAEEKRDEYLDDLRRAHADFENYRRRVMRDGAVQREAGKADVISSLLDVLDDLDRTRDAAAKSSETDLAKGVDLVASKLRSTLESEGMHRVDEVGVAFDPNIHEAVQQRDAEGEIDEPVVAEVLRAGYRLGDRVLRATMVVVEQ